MFEEDWMLESELSELRVTPTLNVIVE